MNPIIFPVLIYGIGALACVGNAVLSDNAHGTMGWGMATVLNGLLLAKHLGF